MKLGILAAVLCLGTCAWSQTEAPTYANFSIMLASPSGQGAVVLMHNPKGELEFIEVSHVKDALSAGYVAVRAAELGEFISALKEENARLTAENERLRVSQPQRAAAPVDDRAERRRQMALTWLMLQGLNRPQPNMVPAPVMPAPAANRVQTNCISNALGNTVFTNCN